MLFELQGCISHCGNYSHILLQLKRFCLLEAMDEPISNPEVKYRQLFINNEFVPAKDGCTFLTENPATGQPICNVSEAKKADVDDAVAAAKAAFKPGSKWRKMKPSERGVLLNKLADLILRDRQYLASLESMDAGKLYSMVYFGDIQSSVEMLRYYAGWADKEHGKTVPMGDDFFAYTKHEPVGVCGGILPWNAPLLLCCVKLGPCLAMGNVLVLKPSELTPLSALYFAALIKEAGFPPGVVNVVPGFGVTAGDTLSHHPDVDKISFTGSVNTGRLVMKAAADSNLKKVSLELGGKSPNIIFSDVDLDYAVEMAHVAIFTHSGQICCAGSRTFVQEDIYDEFVKRSLKRATKGALGDPLDLKTRHGPQISKLQKDKILGYIKSGKDEGCTVLCGGGAVDDRSGHYVQPTILTDLTDDMRVSKEEIFGPVQQIFKFKDVAEVIERANNTTYGLAAAVFTKDINKALAISNSLQAGMVWVNCYYAMGPSLTFGGYKQSGIGREMGEYALKEYTEVKSVIVKIDTPMK